MILMTPPATKGTVLEPVVQRIDATDGPIAVPLLLATLPALAIAERSSGPTMDMVYD